VLVALRGGWWRRGLGSPFTDSTSDQAVSRRLVWGCGCGWVEHCAACSDGFWSVGCSGRLAGAGLGTLLGPEETPACRVFLVPLLVLSSNASVVGVVAVVGWGVVVC